MNALEKPKNALEKPMAVSSHRSPSVVANRSNSNSRTTESGSATRRSFSGNPLARPSSIVANSRNFNPSTPANSPSEFGRRNSIGKESLVTVQNSEQKENEKRVHARSLAVSKGTRNFMSPTISAASKFAASPRKKILAERNETIRPSVSSDGKNRFGNANPLGAIDDADSKSEMGLNPMKNEVSLNSTVTESIRALAAPSIFEASKKDATLDSKVPLNPQNALESLSEIVTMESKCADPSLPPYDPKTNYLSPRPRFLHYRPKTRIGAYLNEEKEVGLGEVQRLEDHFTSECFSDIESDEETKSEEPQNESIDVVSSIKMKEEGEKEADPNLPKSMIAFSCEDESGPSPMTAPPSEDASELRSMTNPLLEDVSELKTNSAHLSKGTVRAKRVPKPHFFARSKSVPLLLIFAVACLSMSVTDSPIINYPALKNQSFMKLYNPSYVVESAKSNFDGLARNFQLWSARNIQLWWAYSISYLSKLIHILREFDELGPLHYSNFTTSFQDHEVDECIVVDNNNEAIEEYYQQNELEPLSEVVEMGLLSEVQGHQEIESDKDNIEEASEAHGKPGSDEAYLIEQYQLEPLSWVEVEMSPLEEQSHEVCESDGKIEEALEAQGKPDFSEASLIDADYYIEEVMQVDNGLQSNSAFLIAPLQISQPQVPNIHPEVSKVAELQGGHDLNPCTQIESNKVEGIPESSKLDDASLDAIWSIKAAEASLDGSEGKLLNAHIMLGFTSLVLTLVAAIGIIYVNPARKSTSYVATPISQSLTKKLSLSSSIESYQNWPTEVDITRESCPLEMSSSGNSSCNKKGFRETDEAQSHEMKLRKNYKRESLASSSSEYSLSPSYGSFTTYEKIASKNGEEETVTPIRRSSRIRSRSHMFS